MNWHLVLHSYFLRQKYNTDIPIFGINICTFNLSIGLSRPFLTKWCDFWGFFGKLGSPKKLVFHYFYANFVKKWRSITMYLNNVTKCKTIPKITCLMSFLTKLCDFWGFFGKLGSPKKLVFHYFYANFVKKWKSITIYLNNITKYKTIPKKTCLRSFLTKLCDFWTFFGKLG